MTQIAPVMHREPVQLDSRYISRKLRAEVLLKSKGRCAECDARIVAGKFEADHIIRWADGGLTVLGNLQALCPPCHLQKTRKVDTPGAAKTKRMTGCLPSDEAREPSRLQGRGFDKTKTRTFKGQVQPRKQRATGKQAWSGGAEARSADCETNHE